MAASLNAASTDTVKMTSETNVHDAKAIVRVKASSEIAATFEKMEGARVETNDTMMTASEMETFEDEPEDETETEHDLHKKRHFLRRKDSQVVGGERDETEGKDGTSNAAATTVALQGQHGTAPQSSISPGKPSNTPVTHPLSLSEESTLVLPAVNGEESVTAAATDTAKTRPKLKMPKPAAQTTRKPKIKIPKPSPTSKHKTSSSTARDESDESDPSAYGSNMDRLAAIPALFSPKSSSPSSPKATKSPRSSPPSQMSSQDLEICRRLDEEYERALEEREIGYNARYNSVRQSAGFSIAFMVTYMTLGTIFFTKVAGWELHQALFFAIYTITTVGYGSYRLPDSVGFQIYTIFYIFVGIATLTIMVAQVYQCIALEASRAQHSRDKAELLQRSRENALLSASNSRESSLHGSTAAADGIIMELPDLHLHQRTCVDQMFHYYDECKRFLRDTEFGRGISVLFPFAGLIAIGAMVVGPIEGWSIVQSLYFAVVSLTTVGYGDFVPTKQASIYFSICWLPFSVGFMSLFLGNIAAFYIRLSDKNIQRLERQMRRRMQRAKEQAEKERAEVLRRALRGQEQADDEGDRESTFDEEQPSSIPDLQASGIRNRRGQVGFESLPSGDGHDEEASVFGMDDASEQLGIGQQRRASVLSNSIYATSDTEGAQASAGSTMATMRDILKTVHRNIAKGDFSYEVEGGDQETNEFLSLRSTTVLPASSGGFRRHSMMERKPSFALRALVQERMARIIAIDVAGFQSNIELNDNTLSVTIDSLPDMAEKWLLPRRARKAFRTVAFEVLYFVGEHGLITRGADALFDLTPFEFHGLFSPLLAAMGDADTMERWLASTDMLASVDLKREGVRDGPESVVASLPPRRTRSGDNTARANNTDKGTSADKSSQTTAGGDLKQGAIC